MEEEHTTREQYIESIKDMTLKQIALKYCKEHHLPRFLVRMLVSFSYPLLIEKDKQLNGAKEIIKLAIDGIKKIACEERCDFVNTEFFCDDCVYGKWIAKAEAFLKE